MAFISPQTQKAQSAMQDLGMLSSRVRSSPSLLFDTNWRTRTAVALFELKAAGQKMQTYEPVPPDVKRLDGLMVSFGKDLVYISDESAAGLDNVSSTRLNNAVNRMSSATAKSNQIVLELRRIGEQYGIELPV